MLWLLVTIAVATLLPRWVPPAPAPVGLLGRYFAATESIGAPILERVDAQVTSDAIAALPELRGLERFSVEWSGFLVVREARLHRFACKSDGESWLWIGDRLVADNGGVHPVRSVTADVYLARGLHAIRVRFVHDGGPYSLQLGQVSSAGAFAHPGPLTPDAMTYLEWRARELWPLALVFVWYVALGALLVAIARRAATIRPFAYLADALSDRTFLSLAGLGLLASAAHVGYGLPALDSWSPDERDPLGTLAAATNGFRDWNLRWPPLQLYLLAGVLEPFQWARRLYGLPLDDITVSALMFLAMRGLGLAMLAATLVLTFDAARQMADRVTGYFAVLFVALSPVVVHFGPLAHLETPSLFWMAASLWSWIHLVRQPDIATCALFGATVGFSLATKDQGYGFYLAAPFALLLVLRRPPGAGVRGSLGRALRDPRFYVVGVAAAASFALGHGLPWQTERLIAHFRFVLGDASEPFQMVRSSLAGQLELLRISAKSLVWAAGLPLTVASLAGCVQLGWSTVPGRAAWLLVPLVTYYCSFIGVDLYVYDRFFIGALPAVAIIGGLGLRGILDARDLPRFIRVAVPATLVAAAAVGATAQNVAFHRDPRYAARDWLARNVACGSSVGVTYNPEYVPALTCYDVWSLTAGHTEGMVRWPEYFVLNEAYADRFRFTPSGRRFLQRLHSGELGFRRQFRAEASPPAWAPLYWEARFGNGREDPETVLDKPLHAIEIWTRLGGGP